MFDKQGQKTVAAKIQQPQQESVEIKPDQTITIDGKQADCFKKACELKQGEATVAKVQTSDGKTQIQLSTKVRIPPACCFYRLNVLLTLFKVLSSEILTLYNIIFFGLACTLQSKISGSRCSPRLYCAAVFADCVVTLMENSGMSTKIQKTASRNWVNSFSLGRKNVKGN